MYTLRLKFKKGQKNNAQKSGTRNDFLCPYFLCAKNGIKVLKIMDWCVIVNLISPFFVKLYEYGVQNTDFVLYDKP